MRSTLLAVAAVAVLTGSAFAHDFQVGNGDTIASRVGGKDEQTFRFVCPARAKLTIRGRVTEPPMVLHLRLVGPGGLDVETSGTPVTIRQDALAESGEYRLVASSDDGATVGYFRLSISWREETNVVRTLAVPPGGSERLPFAADGGSAVRFSVKPASRSAAVPELLGLERPDASTEPLSGKSAATVLAQTGDHALTVGGGAPGGPVVATVKLRPPKPVRRTIRLTYPAVSSLVDVVRAGTAGPRAGGVTWEGPGPLAGASASIPAGAFRTPTAVLLGTTRTVQHDRSLVRAGPAVFVGPESPALRRGKKATVTIPFTQAAFPLGTAGLRVLREDIDGGVSEMTGLEIDGAAHTVRVDTARLGTFQVLAPSGATEVAQVVPTEVGSGAGFGFRLGVDGNYAVVGAPGWSPEGSGIQQAGAAYVYHRSGGTWTEVQRLTINSPQEYDLFGAAVAISGNTIAVGVPGYDAADTDAGAVFVYVRSGATFVKEAELTAPNAVLGDILGQVVALDGDTIAAGAIRRGGAAALEGTAYVFVRRLGVWSEEQEVRPGDLFEGAQFPNDLAVSGDRLIAGSPADSELAEESGAAYVWSRSAGVWTLEAKVHQPAPVANDLFGWSVALDGDTALVGAPERSVTVGRQGAAYAFVRGAGGWQQQAEIVAADAELGDRFGEAVAIRGDVAIVGAPLISDGAFWVGGAYVFTRTTGAWTQRARLTASDPATSDRIGLRVAIGGTAVLVGGHLADRNGSDAAGTAYFFDFVP